MTRLFAVRHGETAWNRTGRLQGWAPVGLTERGRDQARALAAELPSLLGEPSVSVDRLVTSDLRRTRETADLLAGALDLPDPAPNRAFRERHLGVYQGLEVDELVERYPELREIGTVTGLPVTPEAGEGLAGFADRVMAGIADLDERSAPDETVVLVTHGGPIRVMLGAATGTDLERAVREHRPGNCSVYGFVLEDGLSRSASALDLPDGSPP
jgi:probable phosphoglycerate mutase